MNNTLVIAQRELTEKRFVLVAAIGFAIIALMVPLVPGVRPEGRGSAIVIVSSLLAIGFTLGLATILGANIIGRELSDGRLSFYFSKPVSSLSIWFGKLVAAVILVVVSFAIIGAPAMFAGARSFAQVWEATGRDAGAIVAIVLTVAVVLFLLSHVLSTFVRSRSPWIIFDFVAATVCGIAIWLIERQLMLGFADSLVVRLAVSIAIYAGLAIIAGGAWQLARGRTDRKRSHIELSRFIWMAIGCGVFVAAAFMVWVVTVPLSGINPDFADQASAGPWAIIGGQAKHRGEYRATFLYDVSNGRSIRITALKPWTSGASFSNHGQTASWLVPTTSNACELYVAKLDMPKPKAVATGITFRPENYALSDDGSRVAIVQNGGIVAVYELASRASLGSVRIPSGRYRSLFFVSNDVVRVYAFAHDADTQIFEFDIAHKALRHTGQLPLPSRIPSFNPKRALVYWDPTHLEIRDAGTGALIASRSLFGSARFLRDGRIVGFDNSLLQVLSPDGALLREITLPGSISPSPIVDYGGGLVIVMVPRPEHRVAAAVVDIDRGTIVRVEPDILLTYSSRGPQLLCFTPLHDLVLWNPLTGARRLIAAHS